MTKAERAIKACREAADALDAMPFRRISLFGPFLNIQSLRDEADFIEERIASIQEANEEINDGS